MIEIRNPYTKKIVGEIEETDLAKVDQILKTSEKVKYTFSVKERTAILLHTADILHTRREKYAKTITDESGLCLKDTLYEIDRVTASARFAAMVAKHIEEDTTQRYILDDKPGPKLHVTTEPVDLAVGITPFNHPMNQIAHKIFPAIAAEFVEVLPSRLDVKHIKHRLIAEELEWWQIFILARFFFFGGTPFCG